MLLGTDPRKPTPAVPGTSLLRVVRPRRPSWLGTVAITAPAVLVVLVAVFGPLLVPYSATDVVARPDLPPSAEHWFGTDLYGLDVFSRVIVATRNDMVVGLLAALVATVIGIALGLLIGTNEARPGLGGRMIRALARGLDLFDALPQIVLGIVLLAFFGRDLLTLAVITGLLMVPTQTRVVRTEVLRVRGEAYLEAARVSGESEFALILRHVLPNSSWPALENVSLIFGVAITVAAGLGFLGVGLPPPTPEWGAMISDGATGAASGRWWSALFPCIALAVTVVVMSNLGNRLLVKHV